MKFQIASDLHLEHRKNPNFESFLEKDPNTDYLILAGDILNLYCDYTDKFLEYVSKTWKKVFIISGNHEYYHKKKTLKEIHKYLTLLYKKYGLIFLNNESFELDDYLIIGRTLWSKPDKENFIDIISYSNDFENINLDNGKLNIYSYESMFNKDLKYLEKMILDNYNKKIIVVSHHVPHIFSKDKTTYSMFFSDLDYLVKKKNVVAWICGHSHSTKSNPELKIYLNQIGYPDEKRKINKKYIIDI